MMYVCFSLPRPTDLLIFNLLNFKDKIPNKHIIQSEILIRIKLIIYLQFGTCAAAWLESNCYCVLQSQASMRSLHFYVNVFSGYFNRNEAVLNVNS